jgi:FkbM family methyltransferase
MKQLVKEILGPIVWHKLKVFLGRVAIDEAELVYELLRNYPCSNVMIDVGAHHGGSLLQFAEDDWVVFAFEPDPQNRQILASRCERYLKVKIDQRAVSNRDDASLAFYTSDVSTGISSLSSFHPSHKESSLVDSVTLTSFIKENSIDKVGFLKIDTEGHDLFVLQGFPWESLEPEIILCEFEDRKTKPLGYDVHQMAQYLREKGYEVLVSEWYPIVEYGRNHRWRRFMEYPCQLVDNTAWGNLIAVKDQALFSDLVAKPRSYLR